MLKRSLRALCLLAAAATSALAEAESRQPVEGAGPAATETPAASDISTSTLPDVKQAATEAIERWGLGLALNGIDQALWDVALRHHLRVTRLEVQLHGRDREGHRDPVVVTRIDLGPV